MNLSVVLNNGDACNMGCKYCQVSPTCKEHEVKWDDEAFLNRVRDYTKGIKKDETLSVDLWGGEPLMKLKDLQKVIDVIKSVVPNTSFMTSSNGLLLADKDVLDFLHRNNMKLQLSHDGLGQKDRSGNRDPLFDEPTASSIVQLVKDGILFLINCTTNRHNPSVIKNMEFWNKWRYGNHIEDCNLDIKLNRIQDTNDEFGFNYEDGSLLTYIQDFEMLAMDFKVSDKNDPRIRPFYGYISEQSGRYKYNNDGFYGACHDFTLGLTDHTFVIDTLGKFSQCNLMDSSHRVDNWMMERPSYCDTCRFYNMVECNRCGALKYRSDRCEFQKAWALCLERLDKFNRIIDSIRESISNGSVKIEKNARPSNGMKGKVVQPCSNGNCCDNEQGRGSFQKDQCKCRKEGCEDKRPDTPDRKD